MNNGGRKHLRLCLILAALLPAVLCRAQTTHTETPCFDEQVTLTSTYNPSQNADVDYRWFRINSPGDTVPMQQSGKSLPITATRQETYYCEVLTPTISTANNLMKNGDFEIIEGTIGSKTPAPTTFGSDYQFAGWDVVQYAWPNYYVITSNAHKYLKEYFCSLPPHGGKYYALFDASKKGFAWYATSTTSPDLKLIEDSTYIFSYWVAEPNINDETTAKLQFVVQYKDENGQRQEVLLGNEYDTKNAKNKWMQQEVTWKAPANSDDVLIGVRDNVESENGNDFCLDDIVFQITSTTQQTVVHTDTFYIEPKTCCPDMITVSKDTIVCSGMLPFPWHERLFTEEGTHPQKDTVRTADGLCDSIEISYTLSLTADVVYRSRDTAVCSNQLPFVWDGLTFEEQGSQHRIIPTASTLCDSIDITYTLSLLVGVEMYGKWDDVIVIPNRDSLFVSYQWYADGEPIPGATDQFYHNPEGLHGEYYCVMQTRTGGQQTSCPATFDELDRSADHNPGDKPRQVVARRTYRVGAHLHVIVSTFDDQTFTAEKHWIP